VNQIEEMKVERKVALRIRAVRVGTGSVRRRVGFERRAGRM